MFYMKSDDIDELFREAAEKYQIDTEKASAWDDVFDAVHGTGKPGPPTPPEKDHKKRWLNLLWLLLIPLGWFAHNVWNDIQNNRLAKKEKAQQQVAANPTNKKHEPNNNTTLHEKDNKDNNQAANTITPVTGSTGATAPAQSTTAQVNDKKETGTGSNFTAAKPATRGMGVTMQLNKPAPANNLNQQGVVAGNGDNKQGITTTKDNNNATQPFAANTTTKAPAPVAANTPGSNQGVTPAVAIPNSAVASNGDNSNVTALNGNTPQDSDSTGDKKDKKPPKVKNNKERYFYAGMLGSPDISLIHLQKASQVGVSAGIIVGYQFNKHLSVETGALYDKKNYYTKGEYFDKNKIAWFRQRPDVVVHSLDGSCRMIEIPINVRYTFDAKGKNRWYATAGMSSYLMGKESYTYDISHGTGPSYPTSIEYNNHPKNWFSILNLGAGYERSLGAKTNLRVEPFINLPVSGVGSGNISLSSTGIYLGVTRRIP